MIFKADSKVRCPVCQNLMVEHHRYMPPMMNRPQGELLIMKWFCNGEEDGITHRLEISAYPSKDEE